MQIKDFINEHRRLHYGRAKLKHRTPTFPCKDVVKQGLPPQYDILVEHMKERGGVVQEEANKMQNGE